MTWRRIRCFLLGHRWQEGYIYLNMTCDWCVRCGDVMWLEDEQTPEGVSGGE